MFSDSQRPRLLTLQQLGGDPKTLTPKTSDFHLKSLEIWDLRGALSSKPNLQSSKSSFTALREQGKQGGFCVDLNQFQTFLSLAHAVTVRFLAFTESTSTTSNRWDLTTCAGNTVEH